MGRPARSGAPCSARFKFEPQMPLLRCTRQRRSSASAAMLRFKACMMLTPFSRDGLRPEPPPPLSRPVSLALTFPIRFGRQLFGVQGFSVCGPGGPKKRESAGQPNTCPSFLTTRPQFKRSSQRCIYFQVRERGTLPKYYAGARFPTKNGTASGTGGRERGRQSL